MDPLRTLRLTGDAPKIDFGMVTRKHQPWSPLMGEFGARLRSVIT